MVSAVAERPKNEGKQPWPDMAVAARARGRSHKRASLARIRRRQAKRRRGRRGRGDEWEKRCDRALEWKRDGT